MNDSTSKNLSILIVDDDRNVLEVLEARLLSSGFHILKADNGLTALDILKKNKIDLLISDMKMPGMNGIEVLAKARELKPNLPFIFLTAYGSIPDAVKAVKAGADDYLAKLLKVVNWYRSCKMYLKIIPRPSKAIAWMCSRTWKTP